MTVVRYFGLVSDLDRGAGVAGARVEAWDTGGVLPDAMAIAVTGPDGQFEMSLQREDVDALFAGRSAALAFRVVLGTALLARTDCTHQWNLRGDGRGRIDVDLAVPIAHTTTPPRLVVRGRLLDASTGPVAGVTVQAFDRNVTESGVTLTLLGTDTTDARGRYRISFANASLGRAGKEIADLAVRAVSGTSIVAEEHVCTALPICEVDLVRNGTSFPGRSEHARLLESLESHRGSVAWHSLTSEQAGLVACSGRAPRKAVDALVAAAGMAHDVATVSEEVFYGLIRHGLPADRVLLLSHRPAHLRRTLEKALAAGTVSGALSSSLDSIELSLEDAAVAAAFDGRPSGVGLGTLVSHTPSVSSTLQQSFVRKVLKHEGDSAAFWASLDADATFAGHVPALQFTIEVTPLVANHPPMLDHLHGLRTAETLKSPSDLGNLRLQDWQLIVESTGVPSGVLGDTDMARKLAYADWITKTVQARFRTAVIASRIAVAEPNGPTTTFFAHNKSFLFEKKRVAHYLKENPNALANIPEGDRGVVVSRLQTLERLFPITRSYEQMVVLDAVGLHSAYAVHRKGKAQFLSDHASALGGEAEASEIFAAACWVVSASSTLLGKYSPKLQVGIGALPDMKALPVAVPDAVSDWASLFGSGDACACDHCQSVLSPSAYLVDVLQFLGRQSAGSGTGRDLLLTKRPDIAHLELSCNASDTPLPYVDLVLEILEIALSAGVDPPVPWPASTGKNLSAAQDLLAAPDVLYPDVHHQAYTALANAAHPFDVPFHLWAEEARLYLRHLGVPREELIRTLAANPNASVAQSWIAAERLGASLKQLDILGGAAAGPTLPELWGYPAVAVDFNVNFVHVPTFLRAAGLTFDELRELLATKVYPSLALPNDVGCDVSTMEWTAPTKADLAQIHRFLRLRKAVGWSITDMGRAVAALGSINASVVEEVASLEVIRRALDIDVPAALSLFADIDRNGTWQPSLFERLFLRRNVTNGDDAAFAEIFTEPTGAPAQPRSLADHTPAILAAVGGSAADLALVIDPEAAGASLALRPSLNEPGPDQLTLQNLSRIHRIFTLARGAGLTVRDYLTLHALWGQMVIRGDLFEAGTPRSLGTFLDVVRRVRASKLSIAELHYIARHVAGPKDSFVPPAAQIDQLLEMLAAGVKTAAAAMKAGPATTRRATALLHEIIAVSADVESLLAILEDTPSQLTPAQKRQKIETVLSPFLEDILDAKHRLVGLVDDGSDRLPTAEERYSYLLRRLLGVEEAFVKQALSAAFGLAPAIVQRLVSTSVLVSATLLGRSALADFLVGSDPTVPVGSEVARRGHLVRIHKAALLVGRLHMQPAEFVLLFPETGQEPLSGPPWIDLNSLPVEPPPAPAVPVPPGESAQAYLEGGILAFGRLLRFIDLAALRDRWPAGGEGLFALLAQAAAESVADPAAPPSESLRKALSEQLGLPPADAAALVTRFNLHLHVADLRNEGALLRLDTARTLLQRLGASATDAISWTHLDAPLPGVGDADGAAAIARDVKRAARAKYSSEDWSAVARPLRDDLRERQRKALVAFVMAQRGHDRAGALYDDMLIDVEMSPCMTTSRTVQAVAAAQLFVQRALLHLERSAPNTPFTLTEEAAREWEWMKNYRVWEANRKVFLYPENWLEPELRDDKTPLFRAFESRLSQGPLTSESAEKALRTYLEELHEIGHLQIVAVAEQDDGESPSAALGPFAPKRVVHLFGRANAPNVYYYRSFEDGRFTPWEKIDLDLPDSYLVPVVHGGRLFLFWPTIQESSANSGGGTMFMKGMEKVEQDPDTGAVHGVGTGDNEVENTPPAVVPAQAEKAPVKRLSLQFAYSERLGGKFTKKRRPRDLAIEIPIDIPTDTSSPASFLRPLFFLGHSDGESIWIDGCTVGEGADPGESIDVYTRFAKFQFRPCNQWPKIWAGASERDLATPPETTPEKQAFTGHTALSLVTDVEAGNAFTDVLFDDMGRDFTLVADRSSEPDPVRSYVVFSDTKRTFFLERRVRAVKELLHTPKLLQLSGIGGSSVNAGPGSAGHVFEDAWFRATPLYHPRACTFLTIAARAGIDGLLRWTGQTAPVQLVVTEINADYHPNPEAVESPFPVEEVDFSAGGAYSAYNWEVFFHAPLLVASRLDVEQRFAEADKWYRYIFDPTDGSPEDAPARFWKVRPFYENQSVSDLLADLTNASVNAYVQETAALANKDYASKASDDFASQVTVWRKDPFNPHAIARSRPIAFQKAVVLRYIAHLLAWGDKMFRMDTRESVAEATQLYMLASNLLGPKPTIVAKVNPPEPKTYDVLQAIDAFSNALVDVESFAPPPPAWRPGCAAGQSPPESVWGTLYFCLPPNEKLLGLWDVVEDRLFKIRCCMNIDGTRREIPLFEPPIDPALLVRAKAAGLDLGDVLGDLHAGPPIYRFGLLHARAVELTGYVTSLGAGLLSALEKRDGEHLAMLRTTHEIQLAQAVREVKKRQIDEAKVQVTALEKSRAVVDERRRFYAEIPKRIEAENQQFTMIDVATGLEVAAQATAAAATALAGIPDSKTGTVGPNPVAILGLPDGQMAYRIANLAVAGLHAGSYIISQEAAKHGIEAGYQRREAEWNLQKTLAERELLQIDKQIVAAQIRVALAEKDLDVHEQSVEQMREVRDFFRDKLTNEDLYDWLVVQSSGVYYQAYELAYQMAKRAERAYQYERGDKNDVFVGFGGWDGLRQGLLAGERLSLDLRRMEAAYLENNRREYEITKHLSLASHDPEELLRLREGGQANLLITEADFDRDHPTHYMRRLKNVAVTVPCVTGPYQGVNGTLTLLNGQIRTSPTGNVLEVSRGAIQSIVTSSGQNDAGMFELAFRDDRLLPFEGVGAQAAAGAGANFRFDLSRDHNRFDFDSIADLILTVRYTARDGRQPPASQPFAGKRLFSAKQDFPDAWQAFVESDSEHLVLAFAARQFARPHSMPSVKMNALRFYTKRTGDGTVTGAWVSVVSPGSPASDLATGDAIESRLVRRHTVSSALALTPAPWTLSITATPHAELADVWIIVDYTAQ